MVMKKIFVLLLLFAGNAWAFGQAGKVQKKMTQQEKLNEQYCTGLFKLAEGNIITVKDNPSVQGYLNILDWLAGRVAGLKVKTAAGGIKIPYIRNSLAKIYVDEMQVEPAMLNSLSVNDIAVIKIIKGPAASVFGSTGVIAIYTIKDGDEEE
jgi:hypothetical protein